MKFKGKKFKKNGKDTKGWSKFKKEVLKNGGMIGNSPYAFMIAKKSGI